MKLVVMIPSYNEEKSIRNVIKEIPQKIIGIDNIDILVVNDGSSDKTEEVALEAGASRVLNHKKNMGLAKSLSLIHI